MLLWLSAYENLSEPSRNGAQVVVTVLCYSATVLCYSVTVLCYSARHFPSTVPGIVYSVS